MAAYTPLSVAPSAGGARPRPPGQNPLAQQLAGLPPGVGDTTGQGIDETVNAGPPITSSVSNQNPAVAQANQLGQEPNFQPEAPGASPAPEGAPATVTPGGASQGNPIAGYPSVQQPYNAAYGLASQIASKSSQGLDPQYIAGQKEMAKEQYNTMLQQAMAEAGQSAASRGLGGGWAGTQQQQMQSQAPLDLTQINRGIDANAEQTGLQNLIAGMTANQGLAGQVENAGLNRENIANQFSLGQGSLALGNRSATLNEQNSLYDRNDPLQYLMKMYPGFDWGVGGGG